MKDDALEIALGSCESAFGRGKSKVGAPLCLFKERGVKDVELFLKILIRETYNANIPELEGKILIVRKGRGDYMDRRNLVRYDMYAVYPWFNNGRS